MSLHWSFQSVVFNYGEKIALRAFFIITLTYYHIKHFQQQLLAPIENS